ncbi:MAG: Asp-tRNA(Asn)/Glu-tRNA(Gln) amidotransferase subunit GatC [Candidatus Micrarchaeaceae archaeon]
MDYKEFERLLKVCRLRLGEDEKEKMKKDIDEILSYFNEIDKVKGDAEPAYQPIDLPEQLREDSVIPFEDVDAILSNTKTYRFYVIGPKI